MERRNTAVNLASDVSTIIIFQCERSSAGNLRFSGTDNVKRWRFHKDNFGRRLEVGSGTSLWYSCATYSFPQARSRNSTMVAFAATNERPQSKFIPLMRSWQHFRVSSGLRVARLTLDLSAYLKSDLRQADSTCPFIVRNLGFSQYRGSTISGTVTMVQVKYSYYRRTTPPAAPFLNPGPALIGGSHSVLQRAQQRRAAASIFLVFYVRNNNAHHMRCTEHVQNAETRNE
ncbi:uncharacterized protein F5891DRAFT_570359 [Suillus fuscotomentosus]|uniref:Uncharacterized protein n=1 Tax=Suillus fuscotomentosus TaxID=1912939 RepID=A0AAD4E0F1_9AGAM|nr:uncharacterized protein F5891DRAFT_570359 [Suillus fuscotomentosus]KAG1896926.1 hypothetical protein F5891DRAFT_570359 [Suillus fuscotomentosus]